MLRILRNLILVLLFISPVVACSQCDITNGKYTSAGGSEQNTTLSLSANKFTLQHESWQAGNYESRKKSESKGNWVCKGKLITIELNGIKITAKKITIGKNPLGLDESTVALQFINVPTDSFLFKEVLYFTQ